MTAHLPNALPATHEDTCGPYFPMYFADAALEDLTRVDPRVVDQAAGTPIILRGRALDRHGDLANGAILEFWQANAKSVHRSPANDGQRDVDPWLHGYGRLRTASGAYEFRTILPGSAQARAPNITITIFSDGISRIAT